MIGVRSFNWIEMPKQSFQAGLLRQGAATDAHLEISKHGDSNRRDWSSGTAVESWLKEGGVMKFQTIAALGVRLSALREGGQRWRHAWPLNLPRPTSTTAQCASQRQAEGLLELKTETRLLRKIDKGPAMTDGSSTAESGLRSISSMVIPCFYHAIEKPSS
ncbi:uncharacterized protein BJX67DRAFT_153241 [Aspergillus lucknowensis]|uniref:Uncharacterized protein n=1 Tax=Aspergillus lucknowensis TaxID=176173 RepID=A0ABR4LQT5_9EURO